MTLNSTWAPTAGPFWKQGLSMRDRRLRSHLCPVWPPWNPASLREPGLWVGGQLKVTKGVTGAAMMLDRPNYSILAWPPPGTDAGAWLCSDLSSPQCSTRRCCLSLKKKKKIQSTLPLHFADLLCGCPALMPPLSSLSCFRLSHNLVLGHFVRHSAWNLTNIGGKKENKWDATCLKRIQHFQVETHLRVAFLTLKAAPGVYKTAKEIAIFSLLVSSSSGEKFSRHSCWKHSGFSLVSASPAYPPLLSLSLNCSHPGQLHLGPRQAALFHRHWQFLRRADSQRIEEVASIVIKEHSKQKSVSLTSRPHE